LDRNGFTSRLLSTLVKDLKENSKENGYRVNLVLDIKIAQYLMSSNQYNLEDAEVLFDRLSQFKTSVSRINTELISYLIRNQNEESEGLNDDCQNMIELLDKELEEIDSRRVFRGLINLLSMPYDFISSKQSSYLKSLSDHISFVQGRNYYEMVMAFNIREVKKNFEFYYPFLKELALNYGNFNKQFRFDQTCNLLKAFADMNIRSPTLYNQMLIDIGRIFHLLRADDISKTVNSFSRLKMKQVVFL
jgi:hypothetical protein